MKVGVSTYSFNRLIRSGEMDLAASVKAAKEAGMDGIEMLDIYWTNDTSRPFWQQPAPGPDQARAYRKMVADTGLVLSCYTVHNDFANDDPKMIRLHIDRVKKQIDVGSLLGVKFMRIESSYGPPDAVQKRIDPAPYEKRVVEATREVADYAMGIGIRLGVENHGRFIGSFHQIASIIKAVNSPAYGANIDMGNFVVVDEDPLEAVRTLAKYATCVHIKDFTFWKGPGQPGKGWGQSNGGRYFQGAIVGEGDVPVKECLRALKQAGYDGFLDIEHESPMGPVEGVKRSGANIRRMLSEI